MQEVAKDREVLTPPRKKVRAVEDQMPKGIRKATPTKIPPTTRVEDVSVVQANVPPQRIQPPLVKPAEVMSKLAQLLARVGAHRHFCNGGWFVVVKKVCKATTETRKQFFRYWFCAVVAIRKSQRKSIDVCHHGPPTFTSPNFHACWVNVEKLFVPECSRYWKTPSPCRHRDRSDVGQKRRRGKHERLRTPPGFRAKEK